MVRFHFKNLVKEAQQDLFHDLLKRAYIATNFNKGQMLIQGVGHILHTGKPISKGGGGTPPAPLK